MNKKLILSAVISVLLLSGCGTDNTHNPTSEIPPSTSLIQTDKVYEDSIDIVRFEDYDGLMTEYTKERSSNYVHPLPEIVNTWELEYATLCMSNYTLFYEDTTNNVSIMLEIGFNSSYDKISDYFDGIYYSHGQTKIIEITDRYAIEHQLEFDDYVLIGITGEENIRYTLLASSSDETKDPVELLKEYKEILEL